MTLRRTAALVALLSWPSLLLAQTFRGGIQGHVIDATGAAVPGATITVVNLGTKLTRTGLSDPGGNYFFSELPLGEYTVTGALSGFQTHTVKGVRVTVSGNTRVNLELALGKTSETVEVEATLPLVDSTHNTQGGAIAGEQASELPVSGRDFTHLLSLVVGGHGRPRPGLDSPGSFGYLSVNGNRGRANNYLLDGTDMNDGYRNDPAINEAGVFGTPATILPIDAVAEFPSDLGGRGRVRPQRRRHREHRHQVGDQRPARQPVRVLPRRRAGGPELLQQRPQPQEPVPQQPVRRLAGRSRSGRTRPSSSWPTRVSARPWASPASPGCPARARSTRPSRPTAAR